eukprot:3250120-Pleurochrysis_carterae.AAC.1
MSIPKALPKAKSEKRHTHSSAPGRRAGKPSYKARVLHADVSGYLLAFRSSSVAENSTPRKRV